MLIQRTQLIRGLRGLVTELESRESTYVDWNDYFVTIASVSRGLRDAPGAVTRPSVTPPAPGRDASRQKAHRE